MTLTRENLAQRTTGIGASEIAAAAGLSPWATPLDVYAAKVAPVALAESEDMERGNRLEAALLDWTAARNADIIIRPNETLCRNPEHPFVVATPDGFGFARGRLDNPILTIEVKSPGRTQADWTDPADDPQGVPAYYLAQVQWQLLACGLQRAIVSALVWGRLWSYHVAAHPDLQAALLEAGAELWARIERRDPPPPTQPGDARVLARLFRQESAQLVEPADERTQAEWRCWAEDFLRFREEAEGYEQLADVEKAKMLAAIGTRAGLAIPGMRATYKAARDGTRIDWEAVARAAGASDELIAQHTATRPGSRRFLVSAVKEKPARKGAAKSAQQEG
jgi:putative phage-type endonuclease